MVVAKGVNMMDVEKVLKETQIFALHMVEGGGVSLKDAERVHKGGPISASNMVVVDVASLKDVVQAQNGGWISALHIGRACRVAAILLMECFQHHSRNVGPRRPQARKPRRQKARLSQLVSLIMLPCLP
jgi:hypothetical protein